MKPKKIAPEIRIHGGCEAAAIAHYLTPLADKVVTTGNFHSGTKFFRVNSCSILLSMCDRKTPEFERECDVLGVPYKALTSDYLDPTSVPEGTVFLLGAQMDHSHRASIRHKEFGWELVVDLPSMRTPDFARTPEEAMASIAPRSFPSAVNEEIIKSFTHIKENYDIIYFDKTYKLSDLFQEFLGRIPPGSRVIFMADHSRIRVTEDRIMDAPECTKYANNLRTILADAPYAGVVSFSDCIECDDEIHLGGNHYDRMVYFRMAQRITDLVKTLPHKA